jgi:hypothetical protein
LPADALERIRDAVAGKGCRESDQAGNWVGHVIAEKLGMNSSAEPDKATIKKAVKFWMLSGAFVRRMERINGKDCPTVDVGDMSE